MKKLFLLAFGLMALTSAQAQTQQVASVRNMGIVTGNLAIDGKAYPVGYEQDIDNSTITLNVYDNTFNVKHSSVISTPTYEQKTIIEKSNPIKGTVIFDEENTDSSKWNNGLETDSVINTPDDFLRFCYYSRYTYQLKSLEDFKNANTCITDNAGHFIIIANGDLRLNTRYCPSVEKNLPYIETYGVMGYNPATKKYIDGIWVYYWIDYDPSLATTWTVSENSNCTIYRPHILSFRFEDADNGITSSSCLGTQNVFNNDEKTEFLLQDFKEISKEECYGDNPASEYNYSVDRVVSGTDIVLSRYSYDKIYVPCLSVIDEDGTKVCDIMNKLFYSDLNMMRLGGSLYLTVEYIRETVVYSISTDTGIKEVARVKNSNTSSRSYNLAGQQVSADTKGIIIRDGKKFVNK